jgi:hypothetical protein
MKYTLEAGSWGKRAMMASSGVAFAVVMDAPNSGTHAAGLIRFGNAHDDLLAALYDLANAFQTLGVNQTPPLMGSDGPCHSAYQKARALIAGANA